MRTFGAHALSADDIASRFGRQPALVALHWLLASNELQEAALAALLGKASRRSVRVLGPNLPVPVYLRLLSRLCREAAEQTEQGGGAVGKPTPLAELEYGDNTSERSAIVVIDREEPVKLPIILRAGRAEYDNTSLLVSHHGTQPDLILRWNDMTDPAAVDVVVHLHGYSSDRERMSLRNKEAHSGLNFCNPNDPRDGRYGRTSPTLCVLPRGSYAGGESYTFPALTTRSGISDLIAYSLQNFRTKIRLPVTFQNRRLIITAHSGGGNALMEALAYNIPDEIHLFDDLSILHPASSLITWAKNKINAKVRAWDAGKTRADGGLCILFSPATKDTSVNVPVARELNQAIEAAPPAARSALRRAYRVMRTTTVGHTVMPRIYSWLLLADISQPLPGPTQI